MPATGLRQPKRIVVWLASLQSSGHSNVVRGGVVILVIHLWVCRYSLEGSMDVHERARALWLLNPCKSSLFLGRLVLPPSGVWRARGIHRVTTCPEDLLEVRRAARHNEKFRVRGDGRYGEESQVMPILCLLSLVFVRAGYAHV